MSLFQFRWLRRLIRNNTKPIPMEKAEIWKQRLSVAYMFVSFNLIGTMLYLYYSGRPDLAEYYGLKTEEEINKKPAIYYAELLGVKKTHVVRYRGFQKIEEFEYEKPVDEKQKIDNEELKTDME